MTSEALLQAEMWVRLTSFGVVLVGMLSWESLAPRRPRLEPRRRHVARNLMVTLLDAAVVRVLLPLLPVGLALTAQQAGWGFFNHVHWPAGVEVAAAIIVFDLVIYLQHVMFHAVPALWRLHLMHHSDMDFDTTTGLRFHPIEIVLSIGIKLTLVAALGPAPLAVLLFEVILNATAVFNHGNVSLPVRVDRVLRWFVVTPDMHRVHHSVYRHETNRNFGFNLPWWDRLLGTYCAEPADGHDGMTIGVSHIREHTQVTLWRLMVMPFTAWTGGYDLGRRGRSDTSESAKRRPL